MTVGHRAFSAIQFVDRFPVFEKSGFGDLAA
jgi:hypothetical protein